MRPEPLRCCGRSLILISLLPALWYRVLQTTFAGAGVIQARPKDLPPTISMSLAANLLQPGKTEVQFHLKSTFPGRENTVRMGQ